MAVYSDLMLCTQNNTSLTYRPLPWGRARVLAEPFLSPQPLQGLDQTRLRQRNKMARHKQCQNLGGSRNADLTTPHGVTRQTFIDITQHNSSKGREGG